MRDILHTPKMAHARESPLPGGAYQESSEPSATHRPPRPPDNLLQDVVGSLAEGRRGVCEGAP
ncbi:hypothetical protein T484DRAFT_1846744 [Baffinella frigidus]|nr:hypothetical protein T484DRAFT_1846744 [Cryptophyta sp. CCMP2293]